MTSVLEQDCDLPGSRFTTGERIRARYRWQASERRVVGELWFSAQAEGLPGFVHGGALSACADEAMGMAAWCMGFCAPGARISYDFRGPLLPPAQGQLTAWLERAEGRKLWCRARIGAGERTLVEAEGLYIAVTPKDLAPFAGWPGVTRFASP